MALSALADQLGHTLAQAVVTVVCFKGVTHNTYAVAQKCISFDAAASCACSAAIVG
jgi:hypothetical protein